MANANFKRILADGPKNAVVQLIGTLDTSAANFVVAPVIDISVDFTNNDLKETGTVMSGLRLDCVEYSLSDALSIQLFWNSTADQPMVSLAGRGKFKFEPVNGVQPNQGATGYDGDIDMTVNNIVVAAGTPIQIYTLLLHFTKLYNLPAPL